MVLTSFLGSLIALIIIGLVVSAFANYRQQKQAELSNTISKLLVSGEHLAEIAQKIDQISASKSMAAELIGMAAKNFEKILALKKDASHAHTALENARQFAQQLANGQGTAYPSTEFDSTGEITKAKQLLSDAEKIFRRMHDRGDLNEQTFNEYHQELRWLYLDVEVSSCIHQGKLATGRDDRLKSSKFFNHAQGLLKKSSSNDPRKQAKLEEVEELIEKQRNRYQKSDSAVSGSRHKS